MYLSNLLVVALGLGVGTAHAKGCSASNEKAVKWFRFRFSVSTAAMNSVTVASWSDGGGIRGKIPTDVPDLVHPYAGREYAGGARWQIMGTRAYGSGYPYGAQDASTIKGRPFPHGMWPISWGPGYLGGEEYWGKDLDMIRPGGVVGIMNVSMGASSNEVYTMIGDKESLNFMMSDLVRVCHASPASPRKFNPILSTSIVNSPQPRPENVIQYYRSSSFALAYTGYNNTFALASSNPTTNHDSLPLPVEIANSAFLHCVNDTIRASLPLPVALPGKKSNLSTGAIVGIVFGSVGGAFLFLILFACIRGRSVPAVIEAPPRPPPEEEDVKDSKSAAAGTDIPLKDSKKHPESGESGTKAGDAKREKKDDEKEAENVIYV